MAKKDFSTAEPFVPEQLEQDSLAEAAKDCQGCELYQQADHVVFGEGPTDASLMLVGESPGRTENERGRPFVGDAGSLLERALEEAGLSRDQVYITNAVKHIRWGSSDGKRTPKAPKVSQIQACRPWIDAEVRLVKPYRIIALGTRAARSVLGREIKISQSRGQFHNALWGIETVVTYHPAAALRYPDADERDRIFERLVEDLKMARKPPETRPPEMRPRVE